MKSFLQVDISPSFVERVQKIRERILIEQISGVAAADREAFLATYLKFKRVQAGFSSEELNVLCNRVIGHIPEEGWSDDWSDWSDWHDYSQF